MKWVAVWPEYIYICMYMVTCICICICICICMCVYTYIYIYIYTHTHAKGERPGPELGKVRRVIQVAIILSFYVTAISEAQCVVFTIKVHFRSNRTLQIHADCLFEETHDCSKTIWRHASARLWGHLREPSANLPRASANKFLKHGR